MNIRRASEKDIDSLIKLLQEVLEIHANIRPDIFISGTTKYTRSDLLEKLASDEEPIYVAVDENDVVMGYAFCVLRQQPFSTNMVPFKSLYIDDLCVDSNYREQHIGEQLFEYVKAEAKRLGCYEVTLAVWAGNDGAEKFYEKIGMKTKERIMEYIL
jgi:ribosomal protein S18 acetylase RimI-like enzyme